MRYVRRLIGFVVLIVGAEIIVHEAVFLSSRMGISPMVIAMIVVTVESAAPELLVSVNAIWEGAAGPAVGNVIVSNIANILPVLGAAFLPVHEQILSFDIWVILASSVLLLPDLIFGWKIDRMSGMVIASAYGRYVWVQTVGVQQVIG
ncbi:MAG: hypothetical protein P8M79_11225 [Alphaproteobacteria bacterium]|nr:hypothetical protein [Alphaproteobacteria bacterium]